MSENFAELLNDYLVDIKKGEIVQGTVEDVSRYDVIVDVGFKSSCAIPAEQFKNLSGKILVNTGDVVDLFVEEIDNGQGEAVLSREKAREQKGWDILQKAFENNEDVTAVPFKTVRGGLVLDIQGIQAFLPNSLVDMKPTKDASFLINKEIDVKIVKIDKEKSSVLVSRKATLANEDGSVEKFLENLKEGDAVTGVVKNITKYGVFVDLGGVDGLLHITDMSWGRIDSPSDICKIGDELRMKVVKYDPTKRRISLSLKEMDTSPWDDLIKNHSLGDTVKGVVSKVTDYGVFVNLASNMEGLVHNTEISWAHKNPNPEKLFEEGQEIETKIIEIDEEKRRVSLSVKRMVDNPWATFAEKHSVGDKIKGVVTSVTDFGVFVNVGEVSGVVSQEDISWSPIKEEQKTSVKEGDEIDVVVKSIDVEQEKLLLSVRELTSDPLGAYMESHKDSIVEGVVHSITKKSMIVKLADNVYGVLKHSDAGIGSEYLKDIYSVGEEVAGKVTGVANRYVQLSVKEMA